MDVISINESSLTHSEVDGELRTEYKVHSDSGMECKVIAPSSGTYWTVIFDGFTAEVNYGNIVVDNQKIKRTKAGGGWFFDGDDSEPIVPNIQGEYKKHDNLVASIETTGSIFSALKDLILNGRWLRGFGVSHTIKFDTKQLSKINAICLLVSHIAEKHTSL